MDDHRTKTAKINNTIIARKQQKSKCIEKLTVVLYVVHNTPAGLHNDAKKLSGLWVQCRSAYI